MLCVKVSVSIDICDIVKDDILVLESGQQVCNDAHVVEGSLEVNESLLTGESDSIYKQYGDALLSGSSVVSGKCYVQVDKVGQDNYATSLVAKAQKVKNTHSELMLAMKKVTKFTTFLIVPIGIILFYQAYYARDEIMFESIVSCAAALLGMLPKGLVLLTSVSLENGVTRLAKKNVLTQDLYSLETLSHVDVLCLDKTGTITNGKMKVEKTITISQHPNVTNEEIIGSFLQATDDNNATFLAMESYFKKNNLYQPVSKIPFSSLRKWSAIEFENLGTVVVGAVEKVLSSCTPKEVQDAMNKGLRAIAIGWTSKSIQNQQLPTLQPLMVLIISDTIRQNTKETLAYFHQEGIDVKTISGDNLSTVSSTAKAAGVIHSEKAIDMSTCKDEDLESIVENYTVFARVTPLRKKQIVEALQKRKHRVAMTGDGVNDLLALKEADCSIAIADGSDASKQISQVVLLNDDFTCLPDVLLEGRKVVNNVTRVAGVFFIKTIYTILLSIICVLMNQPFPFIPLQITVIDFFIEAMPSFLTIFEENIQPVKNRFLSTVLLNALPYALSIIICYLLLLTLQPHFYLNEKELLTLVYITLVIVSMSAVIRSCYPWSFLRIAVISFYDSWNVWSNFSHSYTTLYRKYEYEIIRLFSFWWSSRCFNLYSDFKIN